jgi:predicted nuclease of predicted toxin-antitoxin system
MKFLIDNALSPLIAKALMEYGYDSVHVRNIGMAAALDNEIIDVALKEERIIFLQILILGPF